MSTLSPQWLWWEEHYSDSISAPCQLLSPQTHTSATSTKVLTTGIQIENVLVQPQVFKVCKISTLPFYDLMSNFEFRWHYCCDAWWFLAGCPCFGFHI